MNKYRPETKVQKKERLTAAAAATAEGKKVDAGKKPIFVKYGINHITALVEAKKAQLVVIANDVDPIEVRSCMMLFECVVCDVSDAFLTSVCSCMPIPGCAAAFLTCLSFDATHLPFLSL
jgi:hypothetical protein